MHRVLVDPIPHGFSPPMGQQTHFAPPVPKPDMDVEVAPMIPNAQSAPNELVGDACQTYDVVADPPHEIPLTQNHPSKCLIRMVIGSLPHSLHPFFHSFLIFLLMLQDIPTVPTQVHYGDGFRGSNSVEIMNDSEPYEIARAIDSDDDRPIGELTSILKVHYMTTQRKVQD